jgi:hypothetical protein
MFYARERRRLRRDCGHVFVEVQQTRPGQAVQAVAKTFTGYGVILGVIATLGIPMTPVSSRQWKAALRVPKAKDGARPGVRIDPRRRGALAPRPSRRTRRSGIDKLWGMRTLTTIAA